MHHFIDYLHAHHMPTISILLAIGGGMTTLSAIADIFEIANPILIGIGAITGIVASIFAIRSYHVRTRKDRKC